MRKRKPNVVMIKMISDICIVDRLEMDRIANILVQNKTREIREKKIGLYIMSPIIEDIL